jgi:hypothetical protein
LSTCRLWNSVRLSSCIKHLSTQLGRSGHLPIDVRFNIHLLRNISLKTLQESLCLLQNNWSRIQDLDLVLNDPKADRWVLDAFNDAIDANHDGHLRGISVLLQDPEEYDVRPNDSVLQLYLPHSRMLESIDLVGVGLYPTQLSYLYSLLELRTLEIYKAPVIGLLDGLFPLLDLMPNLVDLALRSTSVETLSLPLFSGYSLCSGYVDRVL